MSGVFYNLSGYRDPGLDDPTWGEILAAFAPFYADPSQGLVANAINNIPYVYGTASGTYNGAKGGQGFFKSLGRSSLDMANPLNITLSPRVASASKVVGLLGRIAGAAGGVAGAWMGGSEAGRPFSLLAQKAAHVNDDQMRILGYDQYDDAAGASWQDRSESASRAAAAARLEAARDEGRRRRNKFVKPRADAELLSRGRSESIQDYNHYLKRRRSLIESMHGMRRVLSSLGPGLIKTKPELYNNLNKRIEEIKAEIASLQPPLDPASSNEKIIKEQKRKEGYNG